jgi:hypothetical protein
MRTEAFIHSHDGDLVNIRFEGSATVVWGVLCKGEAPDVGEKVVIVWSNGRPIVIGD